MEQPQVVSIHKKRAYRAVQIWCDKCAGIRLHGFLDREAVCDSNGHRIAGEGREILYACGSCGTPRRYGLEV